MVPRTPHRRAFVSLALALTLGLLGASVRAADADPSVTAGPPAPPDRLEILEDGITSVPRDLKRLVRFPVDRWTETRNSLLAIGALIALDKPLTRAWQDHVETSLDGFHLPKSPLNALYHGKLGVEDGWLLTGIGATYLAGFVTNDAKAEETGVLAVKAAAYSVVVSQLVLKSLTGRVRPVDSLSTESSENGRTTDPWDFGHVHAPYLGSGGGGTSMPSYHFTLFFSVATVYSEAYGHAWWPYGLAAVGLASNIKGHHHWVSDMTAGSLVGIGIGRVVSDGRLDGEGRLKLAPYVGKDGSGMALRYRF